MYNNCHYHRESTGHIPVYEGRTYNKRIEDKDWTKWEKKTHYLHYTEETTQRQRKIDNTRRRPQTSKIRGNMDC